MPYSFSTKRYVGIGDGEAPLFSQAWLDLKTILTLSAGWTVTQSGLYRAPNSYPGRDDFNISGAGDLINNIGDNDSGMSADKVWWVMQSPDGEREFLFYRNKPINTVVRTGAGTISNPYVYTIQSNMLNASHMLIAYSAKNKFSFTEGHAGCIETPGNTGVSGANPPIAYDMIWLYQQDNDGLTDPPPIPHQSTTDPLQYLESWAGVTGNNKIDNAIGSGSIWNMFICTSNEEPFPFYFWFANRADSTGFFCMDKTLDNEPGDTDNTVIWYIPELGGIGGYRGGASPGSTLDYSWSIHAVFPPDSSAIPGQITDLKASRIRSWISKPDTFTSRQDFIQKVRTNSCRFLSVSVPKFTTIMYLDSQAPPVQDSLTYALMSQGLSTNMYDGRDELFPIIYVKYSSVKFGSTEFGLNGNLNAVPSIYKGVSSLLKMEGVFRSQFDTLNTDGIRDRIICGNSRQVAVPWNGSMVNDL